MDHIFINVKEPSDALQLAKGTNVRSHVARRQWKDYNAAAKDRSTKERKKKREEYLPICIELDYHVLHEHHYHPVPEGSKSKSGIKNDCADGHQSVETGVQTTSAASPPILIPIGGLRVDPFHSYPVAWNSWLPSLVDHCKFYPGRPENYVTHAWAIINGRATNKPRPG